MRNEDKAAKDEIMTDASVFVVHSNPLLPFYVNLK